MVASLQFCSTDLLIYRYRDKVKSAQVLLMLSSKNSTLLGMTVLAFLLVMSMKYI